jgi:hypothetical protein
LLPFLVLLFLILVAKVEVLFSLGFFAIWETINDMTERQNKSITYFSMQQAMSGTVALLLGEDEASLVVH